MWASGRPSKRSFKFGFAVLQVEGTFCVWTLHELYVSILINVTCVKLEMTKGLEGPSGPLCPQFLKAQRRPKVENYHQLTSKLYNSKYPQCSVDSLSPVVNGIWYSPDAREACARTFLPVYVSDFSFHADGFENWRQGDPGSHDCAMQLPSSVWEYKPCDNTSPFVCKGRFNTKQHRTFCLIFLILHFPRHIGTSWGRYTD